MAKELNVTINGKSYPPPPPTTGSNVINPVVGTKCPYRKIYYAYSGDWTTELKNATRIETEFQDCLGKDCACWTPLGCGRK
jgi:hypothetical protein